VQMKCAAWPFRICLNRALYQCCFCILSGGAVLVEKMVACVTITNSGMQEHDHNSANVICPSCNPHVDAYVCYDTHNMLNEHLPEQTVHACLPVWQSCMATVHHAYCKQC